LGEGQRFGWLYTADGVNQNCKKSSRNGLYYYSADAPCSGPGCIKQGLIINCWMIAECCDAC
jgi:hypothetical protein